MLDRELPTTDQYTFKINSTFIVKGQAVMNMTHLGILQKQNNSLFQMITIYMQMVG